YPNQSERRGSKRIVRCSTTTSQWRMCGYSTRWTRTFETPGTRQTRRNRFNDQIPGISPRRWTIENISQRRRSEYVRRKPPRSLVVSFNLSACSNLLNDIVTQPVGFFEKHVEKDNNRGTGDSHSRHNQRCPRNNNSQHNLPDTRKRPDLNDHIRLRQLSRTTDHPSRSNDRRRNRRPTLVRKQPRRNPHIHSRIHRNSNCDTRRPKRDNTQTARPRRNWRKSLHINPVRRQPQQPTIQHNHPRTLRPRTLQHIC